MDPGRTPGAPGATDSADGGRRNRLFLVSCVKTKRSAPAPAKDLYVSAWFRKASAFVERTGCPWRILSAKHGLVHPDQEIAPYEQTLNRMGKTERCAWADGVLARLEPCLDGVEAVVFLASERYREVLAPKLCRRGLAVEAPMRGLGIGRQLQWLDRMLARLADTQRFYGLLDRLGSARRLAECSAKPDWPRRGVYFFFEDGETRSWSGAGPRVVRVGTHGLKPGSRSTLWERLAQHRGKADGSGGNHRGSIFRLIVGAALGRRRDIALPETWGVGGSRGEAAKRFGLTRSEVKRAEEPLEAAVSGHLGRMRFRWLEVPDEPGPQSERGFIEQNAIALLSGYREPALDPPSPGWLGHSSDRSPVRRSGLWNSNHVEEDHDPSFLDRIESRLPRSAP